jgi:hypothetical protein
MANETTNVLYNMRLELSPLPGAPSGAFASFIPGDLVHATPTLPHATSPGHLLVAIVEQVAGTSAPTFVNIGGGSPPSWTVGAPWSVAQDPSQYGGPGSVVGFGIWWRRVGPGEVTTTPTEFVEAVPSGYLSVQLWEFDTATDPSTGYGFTTGTTSGSGIASGGTVTLPATSQFSIGGFCLQHTDYEYITAPVAISGTVVQGTSGDNNTYAAVRAGQVASLGGGGPGDFNIPPIWIATSVDGSALSASVTYDPGSSGSVLSPYGIAGGVLELPGVTGVPTIPYPGNQVG